MSLQRLRGTRAVVFGGGSGIGAATVKRLASEGSTVVIADRRAVLESGAAPVYQCDIRVMTEVERVIRDVESDIGALDIVVNTVGIHSEGSAQVTSEDQWADSLDVNLSGAFRIGRAALASMVPRRSGVIIHVASDAGLVAWPNQVAYSAAKGGLVHLTRAQAVDAAEYGIRVNCVCPSFTDTPMIWEWAAAQTDPKGAIAAAAAMQPLGRLATPQDIAASIAFLVSGEAAFITGIALPVDGGISAQ